MTWKSALELKAVVENIPQVERLETIYNLREFAFSAVYPSGYSASPKWAELVVPTEIGKYYIDLAFKNDLSIPRGDLYLALFNYFYHHDLLVDTQKTEADSIHELLNEELLSGKLRWPYRYGRLLYDKFAHIARNDRAEHLEATEVADLLNGTPQGVYQVGKLVSGPMGFINSIEKRFLPPILKLPLWHCADTGCSALHQVALIPPQIPVTIAFSRLTSTLNDQFGPPSEWHKALQSIHRRNNWKEGRKYYDLPVILSDAIAASERTNLLIAALNGPNGAYLRKIIGASPRKKKLSDGPADQVTSRLTDTEQLQILMLLEDTQLVSLIDTAVLNKSISIPSSELRRANSKPPLLVSRDSTSELSSLGIRSQRRSPLVALNSAIWEAYQSNNLLTELGWKLTKHVGTPSQSVLMKFIQSKGPSDAIKELILTSMPVTFSVSQRLGFGFTVNDHETDQQMIARLLWKFGFNLPRYDDSMSRFRARISQFNEVLMRTGFIRNEDDREAIRSVGVNLFVSVEHFLEELIAYNVWLLSSDHFTGKRFYYYPLIAMESVSKVLGNKVVIGDNEVIWSELGSNTLGPLMVYLDLTCKWMKSLNSQDKKRLVRPPEDMPHFIADKDMVFPFLHTALWADCDTAELAKYVDDFERITRQLSQSNLSSIRNGLDHKRKDGNFPSLDEMITCAARIRDAFEYADINRYSLKTFWLQERSKDVYGREGYLLHDYLNRPLELKGPTLVLGKRIPDYEEPFLVAPGNLLGLPNAELVFKVIEQSPYSQYWQNYPRRHKILAPNSSTERDPTANINMENIPDSITSVIGDINPQTVDSTV